MCASNVDCMTCLLFVPETRKCEYRLHVNQLLCLPRTIPYVGLYNLCLLQGKTKNVHTNKNGRSHMHWPIYKIKLKWLGDAPPENKEHKCVPQTQIWGHKAASSLRHGTEHLLASKSLPK